MGTPGAARRRAGEVPGGARFVGFAAVLSGAVSAVALAVDGNGEIGGAYAGRLTIYGVAQASLMVALVSVGLALLQARTRVAVAALLGVAGLCAAELAGVGLVGLRRWPLYAGCCAPELVSERDLVRALAAAMALACAVTAVACVVVLVQRRYVWWSGVDLPVAVAFPAALVVALAAPRLVVGGWGDERELIAWALMYSIPIAAGLAAAALMDRLAALAVLAAAACSAVVATIGQPFVAKDRPRGEAMTLVLLAVVAEAAAQLMRRDRRASPRT